MTRATWRRIGAGACLVSYAALGGCDHGPPPELPLHQKACAGKRCGEACNLCPEGNEGCSDTALTRACNADGECVPAPVTCSARAVDW